MNVYAGNTVRLLLVVDSRPRWTRFGGTGVRAYRLAFSHRQTGGRAEPPLHDQFGRE